MTEVSAHDRNDRPLEQRSGQLATLPVFFDLEGRGAIVALSAGVTLWKAELLARTGAKVRLCCSEVSQETLDLAARFPNVTLLGRCWQPDDFNGAALAFGVFTDDNEALAFVSAAKAARVPVNCADHPALCDFEMGAILDRSPVVIGISTHGAAPALARALRGRLDALLPQGLKAWGGMAAKWRARLKTLPVSAEARRHFWERFARHAMEAGELRPHEEDDFQHLLQAAPDEGRGSVVLVGSGPGDPELLTLKAQRALQSADVVLYDDLVAPEIVDMARREAQKIPVGKRGYKPSCKQDHIIDLLIKLAGKGQRVVRLKGGDPMIFGRANEEISALRQAGIPVSIIPGVTAALGAAASLQISLTERDLSRRVQFVTAHGRDGKLPQDLDWRSMCDPRASTVVYMGVRTLPELSGRLLEEGMAPGTPALLIERATCPDERCTYGTIADLPAKVAMAHPDGPCLVMIGAIFTQGDRGASPAAESQDCHEAEVPSL